MCTFMALTYMTISYTTIFYLYYYNFPASFSFSDSFKSLLQKHAQAQTPREPDICLTEKVTTTTTTTKHILV